MEWKASDTDNADYVGIVEIEDTSKEYHVFYILDLPDRLVFGGPTNNMFLESGYMLKDGFSIDETLQGLVEDIEIYYNDGPTYTANIIYNERM